MLAIAIAFPICLMVFNPTLSCSSGVGSNMSARRSTSGPWLPLGRELIRLWRNESSFAEGPGWIGSKGEGLIKPGAIEEGRSPRPAEPGPATCEIC